MLQTMDDQLDERRCDGVGLRRVRSADLPRMAEMACDPELVGEHNWAGDPRIRSEVEHDLRTRFHADGLDRTLIVELDDGTWIGDITWRTERWGPSPRSSCPAFGIALLPDHRGHGYGTAAQRLLIDHLFIRDPQLERVQSDTAADNHAEQRSLEKVGMTREGVVRHAEFRNGHHHDHVLYGILRSEWEARRRDDA
jgi:RimJ/RimL family protein N-acetyltransferase